MNQSIDKSRNLLGSTEDTMKRNPAITYFLHWFTVPVEALLHRNFGERWFTVTNFYAGLIVLGVFSAAQEAGASLSMANFRGFGGYDQPPVEEASGFFERLSSHSMAFVLIAYVLLSIYHLGMIWWRNRTSTPLHSFYAGDSRLEGLGLFILRLLNAAMVPIVNKVVQMMPQKERKKMSAENTPRTFMDSERFTEVFLEPVFLMLLAGFTGGGAMSKWLLISALATAIFASLKHTGKLNRLLDMQDSAIDAEEAKSFRDWIYSDKKGDLDAKMLKIDNKKLEVIERIKNIAERSEAAAKVVRNDYPDVMEIIEGMNTGKHTQEPKAPAASQEVKKPVSSMPPIQSEFSVEEMIVGKEETPPAPPQEPKAPAASQEVEKPVRSMPLRQSGFSVEEMIVGKEETPPLPVPPPVSTPREERPPVAPEQRPIQNWEQPRENTSADTVKKLKLLLIVAGLAIVGLVLFFVVSSLLKKSDTPVKEPDKTETPTPLPSPSPPVSTPPSPPPSTKKLKGQIQTEGGGIVNMRDQPSEDGALVSPIPTGAEVIIFRYGGDTALKNGEQGRWCRIAYDAKIGWVWGKYVKEKE